MRKYIHDSLLEEFGISQFHFFSIAILTIFSIFSMVMYEKHRNGEAVQINIPGVTTTQTSFPSQAGAKEEEEEEEVFKKTIDKHLLNKEYNEAQHLPKLMPNADDIQNAKEEFFSSAEDSLIIDEEIPVKRSVMDRRQKEVPYTTDGSQTGKILTTAPTEYREDLFDKIESLNKIADRARENLQTRELQRFDNRVEIIPVSETYW